MRKKQIVHDWFYFAIWSNRLKKIFKNVNYYKYSKFKIIKKKKYLNSKYAIMNSKKQ